MKVESVNISKIKLNKNNPRKIDDEKYELLKKEWDREWRFDTDLTAL